MKNLIIVAVLILFTGSAFAWDSIYSKRPYRDFWGNHYKHYENMWKDSDRDGVINYFDYNDRNPHIQNPYQKNYFKGCGYKNWKRYYGW